MDANDIRNRLTDNQIPFSENLPDILAVYMEQLKEWNRKIDLTAVTDDDETLDKHFIDSLSVLKTGLIMPNTTMIDVGTGAGFPGLVLAAARPDITVTLMDSQQKRLSFLEETAKKTGTHNIKLIHARAEDGARKKELRERFDYAAARALAPLNVLCEYLLPYVKTEGYALCWKGPALKDEIESGRKAAHLLGGCLEMPVQCSVIGREWKHIILPIKKVQSTPRTYPRKAGIPKQKPLGI